MITRLFSSAVVAIFLILGGNQANAQVVSYGTYYDETVAGVECASASAVTCRVNFSQTPTNNLVMISQISCYDSSTKQPFALILHVSTTPGGGPISRELFFPFNPPLISPLSLYAGAIHENVHYLIGQGRYPYIEISFATSSNVATMSCTIVGDLVTPIS
jgi:hypothetical protein